MNYLFFLLILFAAPKMSAATTTSAFSVETTLSSNAIAIEDQVTLHATLKYPSPFHPNIELMKRRLLSNSGFYEPPFTLVKTIVQPPQTNGDIITQKVDFVLSPQQSGSHSLTLSLVPFVSDEKNIEIASDIFMVKISNTDKNVDLQSLIEPPMALSKELPITLSQANRKEFLSNPKLLDAEAQYNAAFMKSKSFPWLLLISALAVLMVIMLIRLLPSETAEVQIDPQLKEKNDQEIKEELRKLSLSSPKEASDVEKTIVHLDFLLRRYLLNHYEFPAFSYTAQELEEKITTLEDLTPSLKEGMIETFKKGDRVKFAQYTPSSNDLPALLETARLISELT